MPRVLVVRHHLEDTPGLIGEAFVAEGYDLDLVLLNAETSSVPSLESYDAVVILGSTCAVYDDEVHTAWFSKELDLIRDADHRGLGVFGICFGAQALCVAFGGTVAPSPAPEIGWYDVTSVGESPLPTGPFFEFHYDACAVPAHFEVLSRTDSAVQAFRVGRHFGTQYHPEIDAAQLTEWFRGGGDDAVRDFGHDLDELLERTRREETGARERARTLVQYFLAR